MAFVLYSNNQMLPAQVKNASLEVLDLNGDMPGSIVQTVKGLKKSSDYTFKFEFVDQKGRERAADNQLATAEVMINGGKVTYDFEAPSDGIARLSMYSTAHKVGGGILYDDIRIEKISEIEQPARIPVLIVDGFSNHQWEANTEYLKKILETSGKFEVSVSTCPDRRANQLEWEKWNPDFSAYPAIIQTCNNIRDDSLQWPDQVKTSFEEYVSQGGGVYMYHGATNAFKSWPAYNQMIALGWRHKDFGVAVTIDENEELVIIPKGEGENTGHGKRDDVLITRMGNHPIHKGMPKAWRAADIEVYRYGRGTTDNLEVISYAKDAKTGLDFPMEWVVKFGEGRVYCSTYGHLWKDQVWPPSMRCAAFQQSMIRALQWLSNNPVDNVVEADFPTTNNAILRDAL